jgi:hypothetical protein
MFTTLFAASNLGEKVSETSAKSIPVSTREYLSASSGRASLGKQRKTAISGPAMDFYKIATR